METLKTVSSLAGNEALISNDEPRVFCLGQEKKAPGLPPKNESLAACKLAEEAKRSQQIQSPKNIDGKGIMRMTAKQLSAQCFYEEEDAALDVFKNLRNEIDRVRKIPLEQRKTRKQMKKAYNN